MGNFTLKAGVNVSGTAGDDTFTGTIGALSGQQVYGLGGMDTIAFTNAGLIPDSRFAQVRGISDIKLASGDNTIVVSQAMVNQASFYAPYALTIDASTSTGTTNFEMNLTNHVTSGAVVLDGGKGLNRYYVDASELANVTINGQATAKNSLILSGHGAAQNLNLAGYNLNNVQTITLDSSQYFLTLAVSGATINMGTNADTVVVGAENGNNNFVFGAAGQTATGGTGDDLFIVTASTYEGDNINGGTGSNVLSLQGGGSFYLGDMALTNVQRVIVGDASTNVSFDNFQQNGSAFSNSLFIRAGNGNDRFDLRNPSYYGSASVQPVNGIGGNSVRLVAGNGDDTVWLGSDSYPLVSLGTGVNTVLFDSEEPQTLNGGAGTVAMHGWASNFDHVGNNSVSTLVSTDDYTSMYNNAVGFHAIDLGFSDGTDLSFFGASSDSSGIYHFYSSGADFYANNAMGLVVYGTLNGGDYIKLNATDQSYIAGGDLAVHAAGESHSSDNLVVLNAGGLTAAANGTELSGGSYSGIEITSSGAYDFTQTGVTVTGFSYVKLDYNANVNLTLNSQAGGYTVDVNGGVVTDNISGGSGDDLILFGANDTATVTGSIAGGGAATSNTIEIGSGATVDLTATAISDIKNIKVDDNATLTLTSAQIASGKFNFDPPATANLVIDVSTATLNVASLTVGGFAHGHITLVDNNLGDTIYSGPTSDTIILGTGDDWVNTGTGDDIVYASAASGQQAVIIVGDSGTTNTVYMGTASATVATQDTILGADTGNGNGLGKTTVYVVDGNPFSPATVVDFTGATLVNLNEVEIGVNATAVFEIAALTALGAAQEAGFAILPESTGDLSSTLKIIADTAPVLAGAVSNIVNNANIYGFTGTVNVDVTMSGTAASHVVTDVSGVTTAGQIIVDQSATTGYNDIFVGGGSSENVTGIVGTGVETMTGGTGTNTVVFAIGGTGAAAPFVAADHFIGTGGGYVFDINDNTDLTGSTVSGATSSVTLDIAPSVTATVLASVVDQVGFVVDGGSVLADGTLDIIDNVANFYQNNIAVTSPYILETIDASTATAGVSIDLNTTNGTPAATTVIGSAFADTIQAGTGLEYISAGKGNDVVNFDESSSVASPYVVQGSVDGGGGNDTINVGDAATGISVDLTQAAVTSIENFNIGTAGGAQAIVHENQIFNSNTYVGDDSQLVIYVDQAAPSSDVLALSQTPIGPIAAQSSLTLTLSDNAGIGFSVPSNPSTGHVAVVVYADGNGDTIELGGTSPTQSSIVELAYDGAGADTIASGDPGSTNHIVLGAGGADTLYANYQTYTQWQFVGGRGGATDSWSVNGSDGAMAHDFVSAEKDTFDVGTFGPVLFAGILVSTDTDLAGATFVGNITDIGVASGETVVLTDTQLANFAANGVAVNAQDTTSGLVVDVTGATFAPTLAPNNYDLAGWGGMVTFEGTSATGQTFDFSQAGFAGENIDGTGALYVYGGAGADTAIFGGAAGTHGGVLDLGGGVNSLSVVGSTDFTGGGAHVMDIEHVNAINLGAVTSPTYDTATFTYSQITNDMVSTGGSLSLTSAGGNSNYATIINGQSNMDLSGLIDTGYSANIATNHRALLYINDVITADTSVTVVGTNNTEATRLNSFAGSADIISVYGHGDSLIGGAGSDLLNFEHYNVANNYQFNIADLGTGTAANSSDLADEGDIIMGLKAHEGYADISGFTGVSSKVATTTLATGANLGDAVSGFGKYGVVFDANDSFSSFLTAHSNTSELISANRIAAAAADITSNYVETTSANRGFVAVTDSTSDVALFYVDHANGSNHITASEVKLVGVFDTNNGAVTAGSLALPSTFFHIHAA